MLSLILTALLITLCYFWADPAFAFWSDHENLQRFPIFDDATHLVDVIMIWSFLYYAYFAFSFSNQKKTCLSNDKTTFQGKYFVVLALCDLKQSSVFFLTPFVIV